jgi:hypothetical protein
MRRIIVLATVVIISFGSCSKERGNTKGGARKNGWAWDGGGLEIYLASR